MSLHKVLAILHKQKQLPPWIKCSRESSDLEDEEFVIQLNKQSVTAKDVEENVDLLFTFTSRLRHDIHFDTNTLTPQPNSDSCNEVLNQIAKTLVRRIR